MKRQRITSLLIAAAVAVLAFGALVGSGAAKSRSGDDNGNGIVDEKGLAFVPERKDREDAFSLKHTQFQHTVDGTTLTIRVSASR